LHRCGPYVTNDEKSKRLEIHVDIYGRGKEKSRAGKDGNTSQGDQLGDALYCRLATYV
jgi:hypothetical protein